MNRYKNHSSGFLHATLFIVCSLFLVIAGATYIGKRIPTGDTRFIDPVASRHEEAGIYNPDRNPYDPGFDSYAVRDIEAETQARLEEERARELIRQKEVEIFHPSPDPESVDQNITIASIDQNPPTPPEPNKSFTSKINNRISFEYPSSATVTERKVSGGIADATIIFTIKDQNNRSISMTYDKVQGGCFDPIRSFAVNPDSGLDYRSLSPTQSLVIEGKYKAERTDEEIGSYIYAGKDPERPFIYASNICVQMAIPTRLRLSSTQFRAGEQAELSSIYDGILAKLSL